MATPRPFEPDPFVEGNTFVHALLGLARFKCFVRDWIDGMASSGAARPADEGDPLLLVLLGAHSLATKVDRLLRVRTSRGERRPGGRAVAHGPVNEPEGASLLR
jgi:hypothetical protein